MNLKQREIDEALAEIGQGENIGAYQLKCSPWAPDPDWREALALPSIITTMYRGLWCDRDTARAVLGAVVDTEERVGEVKDTALTSLRFQLLRPRAKKKYTAKVDYWTPYAPFAAYYAVPGRKKMRGRRKAVFGIVVVHHLSEDTRTRFLLNPLETRWYLDLQLEDVGQVVHAGTVPLRVDAAFCRLDLAVGSLSSRAQTAEEILTGFAHSLSHDKTHLRMPNEAPKRPARHSVYTGLRLV